MTIRRPMLVFSAVLLGMSCRGFGQEAGSGSPPASVPPDSAASAVPVAAPVAPQANPTAPPAAEAVTVRFNFKGATWDQVLDFFSRSTGLPIVRDAALPDGTVDYLSPKSYALPEALQTLNILLQTRGVMLRAESDKLFLTKLDDMKRRDIPTFMGKLPESVTSDQIVTVVLPLVNAQAKAVAEQLAQMVAAYGSVTAMEKQNALVLVETAAQVRRLQRIIDDLDSADVENVIEFIPIRHAKATEMVKSLTALVGERTVEYVINPANNQRVKLEENRLAGLTIAADERTNAIIGKGTRAKLDQLKQTIELLDVPGAGEARTIRGFNLNRLTPDAAANRLTQLFNQMPKEEKKPIVIQQPEMNRLTLIGSDESIAEAAALLIEIDGLPLAEREEGRSIAVVPLKSAQPAAAIAAVNALLSKRDTALVSIQPGVDGKSVLVAGQNSQVESVKSVLSAVDVPGKLEKQVRLIKITEGDAEQILQRAEFLHTAQTNPDDATQRLSLSLDREAGLVTVVGSEPAISRFAATVEQLRGVMASGADVRVMKMQNVKPSAAAVFLKGIAESPIVKADGGGAAPTFDAVDEAKVLIVSALPRQHQVITQLLATFDVTPEHAMQPLRMFQLRTADAASLAATLTANYNARPVDDRNARPVSISADLQTNMLMVAAHPDLVPEIESIVTQLNDVNRADDQGREIRIFPLKVARAELLAKTIDDMFPEQPVPVDPRGRPRPELQKPREVVVRADPQTNAIIVDAPIQRMTGFEKLVEQLDREELAADTEVRAYRVRHADLGAISQTLQKLADAGNLGAPAGARRTGVTISSEPLTQSLVISGPKEIFAKVDEVLKTLDAKKDGPATVLRMFKLEHAKAESIAPMLREILASRLSQDVPDAGADAASLLKVTADRKTNTLVISAPEAIMSAAAELLKQLDSGSAMVGDPVVRVHPLTFASAPEVAQALSQALTGMISKATGEPLNVKMIASAGSNALILVGPEADLNEVDPLIEPLDARPSQDSIDAKTFELKYADASKIAPIVQNLLTDQQETDPRIALERIRRSRGQQDIAPKVRVEADTRTNSLIVSGPQRTVVLAQTMIAQLDRAESTGERTYATFTPANADALSMVETVRKVMAATQPSGLRSSLELFPEPQTGAILAIGPKADVERAVTLMKERDAESMATPQVDLAIIPLAATDAKAIAPILTALLQDRSRWPAKLQSVARAGLSIAQPSVMADAASNRLLVSAPASLMPIARDLLKQLDQAATGSQSLETKLFALSQAKADQVATAVRTAMDSRAAAQPGSPKAIVAAEASSNSLIVTGSTAQLKEIETIVGGLDRGMAPDQSQVRTVFLKHARAESVSPLVEQLLAEQDLLELKDLPNWARAEYLRSRQASGMKPQVRVVADTRINAVVIAGPAAMLNAAEQVAQQLDVDPAVASTAGTRSVRILTVKNADAAEIGTTLEALFAEETSSEQPPTVRVNHASNSLIVRGTDAQFQTIDDVVKKIDAATIASGREVRTIPVDPTKANAKEIADMLRRLLQKDGSEGAGSVEVISIEELIRRNGGESGAPPRSSATRIGDGAWNGHGLRLAAHAFAVSAFAVVEDVKPDVTIAVDEATNSLVVVGSGRSLVRIGELARQLQDQMPAQAGRIRYVALTPGQDAERLKNLMTETLRTYVPQGGESGDLLRRVSIVADTAGGGIVVASNDVDFEIVGSLIASLAKAPTGDRVVRLYAIQHADIDLVSDLLRDAMGDRSRDRWWVDPAAMQKTKIRVDKRSRTLIVSASTKEHDEVTELLAKVDVAAPAHDHAMQIVSLEYAQAGEIARTLEQFLSDQARTKGAPEPTATIVASQSANTLLVSGSAADMATIRDLLSKLDQPSSAGDRVIEILTLRDGRAQEVARLAGEQFSRRSSGVQGVVITADMRTNSIIVNAPTGIYPQVKALIDRLDAPGESDVTVIRSYSLTSARAEEAVRILSQTLQLDSAGKTSGITIKVDESDSAPVEVNARIIADKRSNSLMVTATPESFGVIESLIKKLEEVPASSPVEYRVVTLHHALAPDVSYTLRQLLPESDSPSEPEARIDYNRLENQLVISATADQFKQIDQILKEIDQPTATRRVTDFVPLKFAQADKVREALSFFYGQFAMDAGSASKQNVRIIADAASNSLVISADEAEWTGIRDLLAKLDREEYDATLQLRVVSLKYADARSVASAINEAFQGSRQDQPAPAQPAPDANRDQKAEEKRADVPSPQFARTNEWVSAAAEQQSNAVILSANLANIRKIEQIIAQIDVPESSRLPAAQFIPVVNGNPVQLANSLKTMYAPAENARGSQLLRIIGDVSTNTLIVRAEPEEFAQIKALAEALQQHAAAQGLAVHILKLTSAPAGRIASAVRDAFSAKARQANLPLSITIDAAGNNLVIASTGPLFEEIKATVQQMDALAPAAGQGIFIIDLENVSPDAATKMIQTIGLDKAQSEQSVSRIVSEPIKVAVMEGRNSLVIVANPGDRETIVSLLKALDSEPKMAEAQVRVLRLKNSKASALAAILESMLAPDQAEPSGASRSRALREQIRRLSVRRDGVNEPDFTLDLTKPMRIQPDDGMNALIVSSTPENVQSIEMAVALLDQLPIIDAVTVQIFPLENIAAAEFARIVKDLYTQGKQLGTLVGLDVKAIPSGTVGKAFLDQVAVTIDERTNTVVVAGREESVAFIEVLRSKLDSNAVAGWIEPRIISLRFADATDLSETLNEIVVKGTTTLPQASPMQKQVGRIRVARQGGAAADVVESEVFRPMTQLVIRPEPQMNSLVVVGTPANIDVVDELVRLLDVEAASPGNAVRIYPVENASASALAVTVTKLFDQQVQSKAIRPEDKVFAQADERTNALVVTTSPRSFAVLEQLLKTLDSKLPPELREIRTIDLQNASAARLASIIQQMMDARMERLRKVQPETADLERTVVVADARTNSLIVAAGNDTYEVIKRLAADLDESQSLDASQVSVVTMVKGNVDRIAKAVNDIMQRRYADLPAEMSKSMRPLVLTDPRTNSLIVAANPEDQQTVSDLIAKLDAVPTDPAVGLHVIALKGSRAEALAPRIQTLMRERRATLGESSAPSDQVTIQPDSAGNTLIVAASDENAQIVRGLIEALVSAESQAIGGQTVEVVSLKTSKATEIVPLVEQMYVNEENRRRGAGSVRATADPRLNAVLVAGQPADIQTLKSIIGQLDGTSSAAVVEIKYIALTSANALETVGLIENVLAGRNLAGRRLSQQATVMKYLKEFTDETGVGKSEMEVSTAIRETINLTPDLRTNTIIVAAPREAMTMIERMIRDLDGSNIGAQRLRIFKMTNADAEATADILKELFNLRRQGNLMVLKPREDGPAQMGNDGAAGIDGGSGAVGLSGTDLTAVPDERQQLSITVDSRTNSLLVSATPNYLDLVEQVVNELDGQQANERATLVYRLKNAVAAEVADVVSKFVEGDQKKLIQTLSSDQLPSASRLLEREVTIVGDEKSNTVLVNASPRYMEQVKAMIMELDIDPPQVLIQVLLAEVTLDSKDEFGVDFNAVAQIDDVAISGGYRLASAAITGFGVPNLAVAGDDFNFLLKAMQSQGRLNVLSNPSIMTANNEEAQIQVGETVRLPESTSFDQGSQQSSVVPEDIGVILKVTPSINPEGFVRMDINPEISSLSQRTTQISENFESPIITRRRATTTVTVKDGQTVVIGGLISNRYERRDSKVPILGDVPLIGALFRSKVTERADTELLIVLTPHVIMSPSELRVGEMHKITEDEINRLTLPADIKEQIRKGALDGTGGLFNSKGERIYTAPASQPADAPKPEVDP